MSLSQPLQPPHTLQPPHSLGVHTTLATLPAADRPQALAKAVRNVLLRQPKRGGGQGMFTSKCNVIM